MKRALSRFGLLAILVGTPAVLAALAGGPHVPSFQDVSLTDTYVPPEAVLGVVAFAAWIVWLYLLVAVTLRALALLASRAEIRGGEVLLTASALVVPPALRRLIDIAVGGSLIVASLSPRQLPANVTQPRASVVSVQATADPTAPAQISRPHEIYCVRTGDSLWRIAERKLGSGFRWREIFELNRGRRFADGETLTNPRLIRPGWRLELPLRVDRATPRVSGPAEERATTGPEADALRTRPTPTERGVPLAGPSVQIEEPARNSPAVRLPSGLALAATFAAGMLSAELLGRLRRRRLASVSDEPPETLQELPLVRELRHAGAERSGKLDVALEAVMRAWRSHHSSHAPVLCAVESKRSLSFVIDDEGSSLPPTTGGSVSPQVRFRRDAGTVVAEVTGPFGSHGRRVGEEAELLFPVGQARDGSVVHVSPIDLGFAAVTGARATEMLRDLLLHCAAMASPEDLHIVLLAPDSALSEWDSLPHCTATATSWEGAPEALRELQVEFLRRARLFAEEGVETIREHMSRHDDDRLPQLLVVASAPPIAMRGLVESVGRDGSRFGAGFIALGWQPSTYRLSIDLDESSVRLSSVLPLPGRLVPMLLDGERAHQALDLVRAAWTEPPPEEGEADSASPGVAGAAQVALAEIAESGTADAAEPAPVETSATIAGEAEDEPSASVVTRDPLSFPSPGRPSVLCLGPYLVQRDGRTIHKGWRSRAKEMLAYLAAHPEGVPKERVIDALWPEFDPAEADLEFRRNASKIRAQVRAPDDARRYVVKEGESFLLEPEAWSIDVWDFSRLIVQARAADREQQRALLSAAVELYRGSFCSDCYYSWVEPIRERLRTMFLRASARLAELLCDERRYEEALAPLEKAIEADPVNEELCRRAMAIEVALGRAEDALARAARLEAVLSAEIGVEPSPATQELVSRIRQASERARRNYLSTSREPTSDELAVVSGNTP